MDVLPRIQVLRNLIEEQIEVVAAAICDGKSPLEAELRLEWLTRELVIEESGERVFTHQSIAQRLWDQYRWATRMRRRPYTLKQPRSN
ncbi:hypothetical protein ABIG06_001619 [Bradyrhizobium sp. USDA 326]